MEHEESSLANALQSLEHKIDVIDAKIDKIRKYVLVFVWIMVIATVLPLIGLLVVIPSFINSYLGSFDGLL